MVFKNLALSMSSEKESFDAYLTRMAADGVWLRSADRDRGLVKRVEQLKKQVHQLQTQNTLLRSAGLIQTSPRVDAGAAGSGGAGAGGNDAGGSAAGGAVMQTAMR